MQESIRFMKRTHLWRLAPGAALILLAGPSLALTLGRAQGVALIGRPLDLTVPIVMDSERDAADLCPRAEVFYGDNRVEMRAVELLAPTGHAVSMRVRVAQPVNEAFVTVQAQVGCTQTLTRRFVLLTEFPGEPAVAAAEPTPVAPAVLPAATSLPVMPAPAPAAAAPAPQPPASVAPARPARAAAAERPRARPTRRVAPAPAPAPARRVVERPRLKLDAPVIQPKSAAAPAATVAPPSAPAAAPTPTAAQAEELVRSTERMVALEADMRALRESLARSEALMVEMRTRLEQAEQDRYANHLVYALAALLAASTGLAAWLWRRGRRPLPQQKSSWWADRSTPASEPELHEDGGAPARPAAMALPPHPMLDRPEAAQPVSILGSTFGTEAASGPAPQAASASGLQPLDTATPPTRAALAAAHAGEPLDIEQLAELQQQSAFFLSLGEEERAVAVLRAPVEAQPQASVVPWLELLDLFHRLQRPDDYEQLRRDFEWLFGVEFAPFEQYEERQAGLEAHPGLLGRIQALWGSPGVLAVIEEAIAKPPAREAGNLFGVEAMRELVLLHGVADDQQAVAQPAVAASPAAAPAKASALGSGYLDLDVELDRLPSDEWQKLAAPHSRAQGLDVNLDDLDLPPAQQPTPVAAAARDENALDFDLDLSEAFKPPKQR